MARRIHSLLAATMSSAWANLSDAEIGEPGSLQFNHAKTVAYLSGAVDFLEMQGEKFEADVAACIVDRVNGDGILAGETGDDYFYLRGIRVGTRILRKVAAGKPLSIRGLRK